MTASVNIHKPNFDNLDLLKALAMYFVVFYHFNLLSIDNIVNSAEPLVYIKYISLTILSTCVPLFFFVNGALVLNRSTLNLKKHIFLIFKIIVIIIIWGVLTFIALMKIRHISLSNSQIAIGILQLKLGWINHLWFLAALVTLYIFLPIIYVAYKNDRSVLYYFFLCVMVLTFGNVFIGQLKQFIIYLRGQTPRSFSFNYFFYLNPFVGFYAYSLGYFILGGLMHESRQYFNNFRFKPLVACGLVISILLLGLFGIMMSKGQKKFWDPVWNGYDSIFTLINVCVIYIISIRYSHRGIFGKLVGLVSKNSLGIYLIHIPVGSVLTKYATSLAGKTNIIFNICFAFAILLLSLLLVSILRRIPIVKQLVAL